MAQDLDYLPPVITAKVNKDTGTCLILNTLDFARMDHQTEIKPYVHSIQIVDADQPWPPRWYMAKPIYTDEMFEQDKKYNTRRYMNFIENPEINSGYIFYLQIYPLSQVFDEHKTFDVQHNIYIGVLNKDLDLIDSINTPRIYGGHYGPDYRTNPVIEKLTMTKKDTIIDWRSVSGNQNDSAIDCEYGIIQIVDAHDKVKFTWNPLDHMDHGSFRVKEKLSQLPPVSNSNTVRDIRWLKLVSINWDYDGNFIYAIEDFGIGKVSKKDGHIMWHFNYADMPFTPDVDTFGCYSPYDFKFLKKNDSAAIYTFYERGTNDMSPGARGVVFEVNKKTSKIKLIKYITTKNKISSSGQGGFDYNTSNGNYVIDYGVFDHSDTLDNFWDGFEYGRNDSTYAIYQIPKSNYIFGAHRVENFPIPPRPHIEKQGEVLVAVGKSKEWTWYKLSGSNNTSIKKVGMGQSISPEKGAVYCIAGRYGIGYSVSKPFYIAK